MGRIRKLRALNWSRLKLREVYIEPYSDGFEGKNKAMQFLKVPGTGQITPMSSDRDYWDGTII